MDRKLLFFDIDGTLAMPEEKVTSVVIKSIRDARKNGHLAFLCTGRAKWLVENDVRNIGFDGGIYNAGGCIEIDDKNIFNQFMSRDLLDFCLDFFQKIPSVYLILEAKNCCYESNPKVFLSTIEKIVGANSEMRRMMEAFKNKQIISMDNYNGEDIYKITYFIASKKQKAIVDKALNSKGRVVWFESLSTNDFCNGEVTSSGVDKGAGMHIIRNYYNAEVSDCIAFGDSMNDLEVLEAAGLGIAMGNSEEEIKKIADKVIESVHEDGVAKELARLGLVQTV